MQVKHFNPEKSANGFQQIWNRLSTAATGSRDYAAVAYRDNPDSLHDEGLIFMWIILTATLVFTGGYGIYYHYTIFSNAFSVWAVASGIISACIFLLGEVMKVGVGLLLLRLVFTGNWNKDLQSIGITTGLLVIVVGAFAWSYDISRKGTASVNEAVKVSEYRSGLIYDPASYTSPLDSQIASLDADIKRLSKMKVESGEISWPAQKAIGKAQDSKAKLLDQRNAAEMKYQAQQDSTQTSALLIIRQAANQLGDYGGFAEILCLVCLFTIGLIESRAYEKYRNIPVGAVATSSPQPTAHSPQAGKTDLVDAMEIAWQQFIAQNKPVQVKGFRNEPDPPVQTPPLSGIENRGGVVATTFHSPQPTAHSPQIHVANQMEIVEDIELSIIQQLDRFGKYYPSKWNARGKGGGKPETIAFNLANALEVIDGLLAEGGVGATTLARVERCRKAYREDVLPAIKNPDGHDS